MNKIVAIVVGLVVIAGGAYFLVQRGSGDDTSSSTKTTSSNSAKQSSETKLVAVDACDVLTETSAKQLLGDGAQKGDAAASAGVSTADMSVNSCTYFYHSVTTGPALDQVKSTHTVSVFVRAAKTAEGAKSNKAVFTSGRPASAENVEGYGDAAFWSPTAGQLDILKGSNWYILSNYVGVNASSGTLDQAKVLADEVSSRLQ